MGYEFIYYIVLFVLDISFLGVLVKIIIVFFYLLLFVFRRFRVGRGFIVLLVMWFRGFGIWSFS